MLKKFDDWDEWVRPYLVKKTRYTKYAKIDHYCVKSVPFRVMVENNAPKGVKWLVDCVCDKCGKKHTRHWNELWGRKILVGLETCRVCVRKGVYSEEWRRHNSDSQKLSQGTPEAREKMSKRLKYVWDKHPEIRQKISDSLKKFYDGNIEARQRISETSKRNWSYEGYQEKVTGRGYHHGWFISRCGRIFFASSWELMFLVWCDKNEDVLSFKRSTDRIHYLKPCGGDATYYPDFDVEFSDHKIMVFEVKGGRSDIDLVERKRVAAEEFYCGVKDYTILYKKDLQRMGIMRSNKFIGKWILELVGVGIVDGYGFAAGGYLLNASEKYKKDCPQG